MMKKKKKLTILIALLLTVSLLAGCAGNAAETTPAPNQVTAGAEAAPSGKEAEEPGEAAAESAGYRAQYLQLADSSLTAGLDHASAVGDTVYFTSLGVIADENGVEIISVTGNGGIIGAVAAIGCADLGTEAAGVVEDFQ